MLQCNRLHLVRDFLMRQRVKSKKASTQGTQAIVRATQILKAIGTGPRRGLRIVDLCERLVIERPTVHRILTSLAHEGFVVRDESKRYLLGDQIYRLGLVAGGRTNLREICEGALTRIAAATGDTVFLATRQGDDALVIDRRIGTTPVRAMPLDVGMPRPLGVGATGLAIMGTFSDAEVTDYIRRNASRLREHGLRPERLPQQVARSRKNGYAYSRGYGPPRLSGIGVALQNREQRCIGAVSVTNLASRMTPEHRRDILTALRDELALLGDRLRLVPTFT
jgi:DNA-binding IclR family transcriptional regulator